MKEASPHDGTSFKDLRKRRIAAYDTLDRCRPQQLRLDLDGRSHHSVDRFPVPTVWLMSESTSRLSWIGEFADPEKEAAFVVTTRRQTLIMAWVCVLSTGLTSLSFVPLDVIALTGDRLTFHLIIRVLIAIVLIGAAFGLLRNPSIGRILAITYRYQLAFFVLNATVFGHPFLQRQGGAFFPLIAIALVTALPGSFRAAAGMSFFAAMVSLLGWAALGDIQVALADVAMVAMLTVVALAIGCVSRVEFGAMRRRQHLRLEQELEANRSLAEAKEAAEAGARAKSEFLAMMSHEIRTPMNGVLGMARLVLGNRLDSETRDQVATICNSAETLLAILDDILDFSKLEAGKLEVEHIAFDPRQLLDGIAGLMRPQLREKGLELTLHVADAVPAALAGDPNRIRQILFNLIGNAVKFTERGSVSVSVERVAGDGQCPRLHFAVVDTGPGIPEAARSRLFGEFSQLDGSIARRFGGTGLGLAICRRLVTLMGGTIGVDSAPGCGSVFWFELELPVAERPAAVTPAAGAPPLSRPLKILLAEDNLVNQKVAQALLQRMGHQVRLAPNGFDAVAAVETGSFDVVLMDMQMPGLDGLEATARIRQLGDPAKAAIPIIALTANALKGDDHRCLAAGMDDYLAKPIQPDLLSAVLARVADRALGVT